MTLPSRIAVPGAVGLALAIAATSLSCASRAATAADASTTEANITRLTTSVLERSQFAKHPFDSDLAGTLLQRYVDALDGSRTLLLQSDVDEFAAYRDALPRATREAGNTHIARAIFRRYLERVEQQSAYVTEALRAGTFDFTGHDVYAFDRANMPRPRDLAAARALWRQQLRAEFLQEKLAHKKPEQIVSTLLRRQDLRLRTMKALGADEVLDIYLDALAHVYDPHSDYLGHEQMDSFAIAMNLSLFGVGATLESVDGYCTVRSLVPGGPAARSGLLKPGDRIVAVAQVGEKPVDVVDMPLSHLVELIRGPKGSTVTLSLLPPATAVDSRARAVSLVRDEVKLEDQEAKARIVDLPTRSGSLRLGIIDLPSFYADMSDKSATPRSATADVARLLAKLQAEHVHGVVLDLRQNGGGSLKEAIALTGLFIRKGPIVQTRDQGGRTEIGTDDDATVQYDGPLVVLTSRFTASASEILAGALQDYGRALIVGDTSTFGKGTVQNILPLARVMDRMGLAHTYDPGALKVTISKFYRPSGASTQLRGVASDIVLPSTTDVSGVGESHLEGPLPWDTVPPTSYDHLDRVRPYVAALRENSERRVAADDDFASAAYDIARLSQTLSTKTISLNESDRRQELADAKVRHERREQEDRAERASQPPVYEITPENASSPDLPAPVAPVTAKSTAAVGSPASPLDADDAVSEPDEPDRVDEVLHESLRILADYESMLDAGPREASNDVGPR